MCESSRLLYGLGHWRYEEKSMETAGRIHSGASGFLSGSDYVPYQYTVRSRTRILRFLSVGVWVGRRLD